MVEGEVEATMAMMQEAVMTRASLKEAEWFWRGVYSLEVWGCFSSEP
jgi:hypothetical protein